MPNASILSKVFSRSSALVFVALAMGTFAACASGTTDEPGYQPTGGSGNTSTGGSGAGSNNGIPCTANEECESGICLQVGQGEGIGRYCVTTCPPDCGAGSYCAIINGKGYCVPDRDHDCSKCVGKINCLDIADACLTSPLGDKFCARDCTIGGKCPAGFSCVDEALYQSGGWPGGGGAGGGGSANPTSPERFCVPDEGGSCPCDDKRDGVSHDCSVENQFGLCSGTETCAGATSAWGACSATTPAAEACNGQDDNCDGGVDEGDPNALCAALGAPPAHSSWVCQAGACEQGPCNSGWIEYPVTPEPDGCNCSQETGEPNGGCANAVNKGTLSDTGAGITVSGTLSSDSDVDFYTFQSTDVAQGTTNSYHVDIHFTAPAPNNEFLMDVIRGSTCVASPTGASASITSYDWCVNGSAAGAGEAPCGPTSANHCADHSSQYYVRVYRKPGATGTCTQYTLSITANGGTCTPGPTCP